MLLQYSAGPGDSATAAASATEIFSFYFMVETVGIVSYLVVSLRNKKKISFSFSNLTTSVLSSYFFSLLLCRYLLPFSFLFKKNEILMKIILTYFSFFFVFK